MRIGFFLQNNIVERNSAPVAIYAHARGYDVIDRSSTDSFDVMNCDVDWDDYDIVIPVGSVQFIRKIRNSKLSSHIDYDARFFATDSWTSIFSEKALNYDGFVATAADVPSYLVNYELAHIRPNVIDKAFVADLFSPQAWDSVVESRKVDPGLEVFISTPKKILSEFRSWIVDGLVVETSMYRKCGSPCFQRYSSDDQLRLAQSLADVYLPSSEVVLDYAVTESGVRLIEFNPLYSAGYYAGDVANIFDALIEKRKKDFYKRQSGL